MARLLLIRHAESEWNALGRWQGQSDPPLSERGELQAKEAALRLAPVTRFVSSDLQRARQTAEILAGHAGVDSVELVPAFRERNAGEWEGLTSAEVEERFPGLRASGGTPKGWESDTSMLERVLPALSLLGGQLGDADAAVVTHGGVIRVLESHLQSVGSPVQPGNLCARWIEIDGKAMRPGERCNLLDVI